MLTKYIQAALRQAGYELIDGGKAYYGEIAGFEGVYARAGQLERCREELEEVLEEWLLLRISKNLPIPEVDGIRLVVREVA